MRALLRWIALALLALVVGGVVLALTARFSDGPFGPFPGGSLQQGELTPVPENWSFAADVREIELQLVEPPRSRTTWLVVHDGTLYVPCGFLQVPLFKQWPHQALRDGRAVLRLDGKRYAGRLVRVEDPALFSELARLSTAKYGYGEGTPPDRDRVWFFRFEPRTD
jgi:hypothetical protein